MTELAYLTDTDAAYRTRFSARVVSLPPGAVVLDRTYFYPTGGGQPADTGTLEGDGSSASVVDVSKSGPQVVHRLGRRVGKGAGAFAIGQELQGVVDWPRRHLHMRLHTAQHLLSARLFLASGLRTHRANLGGSQATLELEADWPESVEFAQVVRAFDADRAAARRVRVVHVPRAEFQANPSPRSGLVPLPPSVDPVRVIEIEGVDQCPCGGTHLRSTGEIGPARLSLAERRPGSCRVSLTLAPAEPPTPLE